MVLSAPAMTSLRPSVDIAMLFTPPSAPVSVRSSAPVCVFQSQIEPSLLAAAIQESSAQKATLVMGFVGPFKVCILVSDWASQIVTNAAVPPAAKNLPSPLKESALTG